MFKFFYFFLLLTIAQLASALNPVALHHISSLSKRQDQPSTSQPNDTQVPTFQWPEVDGSNNDTVNLVYDNLTTVGYWYFNATFFNKLHDLGLQNYTKAAETLFEASVENLYEWVESCWAFSNQSAKENNRENTLARVGCIPNDDPTLYIPSDIHNLSAPVEFACFERAIDGDPDVPLFNHTEDVLEQLKWDKQSSIQYVEEQNKNWNLTSSTNGQ